MTLRLNILVILLLFFFRASPQEAKVYFKLADSIVTAEISAKSLLNELDSLKSRFIPSRSSMYNYFDRDIDLGYQHQRINLQLNLERFQIDLFKRNDTIYSKTIRHYYNPFDLDKTTIAFNSSTDTTQIAAYLKQRNELYNSKKTISDLTKEISKYEVFAFYCGDGLPETDEGKYIKKLVEDKNINALTEMLQSFCVESQAYGVSGYLMLKKKGYTIPTECWKLIKYIQIRNSQTITCSGCLTGLVKKIY